MKKIYIMTWNTGLYREKTLMPICQRYRSIIKWVKEYLENQDAICFLQEIPYYSNETWEKHTLFLELEKDFPQKDYDIKYNVSSKKQIMMTVVIAKKGTIEKVDSDSFNSNRILTVKYKDIKITGLHAYHGKDNAKDLENLNSCSSEIVLGDFNAGNYIECENRTIFNHILKEHVCICNIATRLEPKNNRRMCVDHVFVQEQYVTRCRNMIVHENAEFSKLSDHFPLTFEFILEN